MIRSALGLLFGAHLSSGHKARALGASLHSAAEFLHPRAAQATKPGHDICDSPQTGPATAVQHGRISRFDGFVNGLNRLPRPLLALGTLALFGYAMSDPVGFSIRMQALGHVPEPLWWLLGGIVAFYFGAREAHHLRCTKLPPVPATRLRPAQADPLLPAPESPENPALAEWQSTAR